jgi:two-component system response regulator YesN
MKTVLLVDDEQSVVEAISRLVPWEKCGVCLAGTCLNGFEALEKVELVHPDIVITDIKMPVMNGVELIRRLRKLDYRGEVIVLSGYNEFEFAKEAMKEGVKHYLLKPCGEDEIIAAIREGIKDIDRKQELEEARRLVDRLDLTVSEIRHQTEKKEDFVEKILEYVEGHLEDERLGLRWVASELVYMNEDYVGQAFTQKVGENFTSYLNRRRVEKAKYLISELSEIKIYVIAEQVGYGSNPHYFSKIFKKYTGFTPSEYKEVI